MLGLGGNLSTVFVIIGLLVVLNFARKFVTFVWVHFLRPAKSLKELGQWAVVTGASDGIGKGYAMELARRGLNIFLLSRSQSKLDEVSQEIQSKFKVETKTLAIDFTKFQRGSPNLEKVSAALQNLEIGVLINNVGISYQFPQYFAEISTDAVSDLLACNLDSTVWLTRAVLPSMEARRSGAIVNVSSLSAHISSPLLSVYSATKAFIENFSISLNAEYKSKGISVQSQTAAFVATKLAKIRSASLTVPSPAAYARAAVKQIGYEPAVTPFWAHDIQLSLVTALPKSIAAKYVLGLHKGLRGRALKKQASQEVDKQS